MSPTDRIEPRPYLLTNQIQHYAWGTRGEDAFIPRLLGTEAEPGQPYAELWIGAHPKAPSAVLMDGDPVSLGQLISRYPREVLGATISERFARRLPFLFKVLSAAEALSIQAHPNKGQAEHLHARDPEHYPDDNHKPELAVALDSLTALVGFKTFPATLRTLERYPEVAEFIGGEIVGEMRNARNSSPDEKRGHVRRAFSTLIERSITGQAALAQSIERLGWRLRESAAGAGALREEEKLFLDLKEKYTGGDVGLFALFLLNLIHLGAGQGVFLKAGIPHAYVRGNIVECMANSDNVVRVGLTPKFKDAEALIEILTDETGPPPILGADPDGREVTYRTPVPEFQVTRWELRPGERKLEETGGRLEILLVTGGEAALSWKAGPESARETLHVRRGQSILIPARLSQFRLTTRQSARVFKVEVPPAHP